MVIMIPCKITEYYRDAVFNMYSSYISLGDLFSRIKFQCNLDYTKCYQGLQMEGMSLCLTVYCHAIISVNTSDYLLQEQPSCLILTAIVDYNVRLVGWSNISNLHRMQTKIILKKHRIK